MLGAIGPMELGGDIWSTGAFANYDSPLKDLLDTNDFTIGQLLAEDELLQEIRGCHPPLLEALGTVDAVRQLITYIVGKNTTATSTTTTTANNSTTSPEEPPPSSSTTTTTAAEDPSSSSSSAWLEQYLEKQQSSQPRTAAETKRLLEDPEYQRIRLPYMACEVLCSEIPAVLNILVSGQATLPEDDDDDDELDNHTDTSLLDLLFSILMNDDDDDDGAVPTTTPSDAAAAADAPPHTQQQQPRLDDTRAGYVEKIFTVLSRNRPVHVTAYMNSGGSYGRRTLMQQLIRHLYSHSMMQIAQQLLLPHRPHRPPLDEQEPPPGEENEEDEDRNTGDEIVEGAGEEDIVVQCDWAGAPEILPMLLELLDQEDDTSDPSSSSAVLSLNASDVLITIIQNSLLSSPILLTLTEPTILSRLVDVASIPPRGVFARCESTLTSGMNVLESLILQLGGYGALGSMTPVEDEEEDRQRKPDTSIFAEDEETEDTDNNDPERQQPPAAAAEDNKSDDGAENVPQAIATVNSLKELLPTLLSRYAQLLVDPVCATWTSPTQFSRSTPVQMLGTSRLRIVRVVESLVLLGDPEVDSALMESDCLRICLSLFWEFQWCSMLHQSVANLLVHVLEGQNVRRQMQEYFLGPECNLLQRLMQSFQPEQQRIILQNEPPPPPPQEATTPPPLLPSAPATPIAATDDVAPVNNDDDMLHTIPQPPAQAFRYGYMGHVIIICQALVHAYSPHEEEDEDEGDLETVPAATPASTMDENDLDGMDDSPAITHATPVLSPPQPTDTDDEDDEDEIYPTDDFGEPLALFDLVCSHPVADQWHDFCETTLSTETAIQSITLGGFPILHNSRPGLVDEGTMMGDEGDGPPAPPRGGGVLGVLANMDENDMDHIAASMMEVLSAVGASPGEEDANSQNSGSSGDTARQGGGGGYAFDDPLGRAGSLGIELGKLTQLQLVGGGGKDRSGGDDEKDEDGSHSSSDEETPAPAANDVPVMDLFAGNFNYTNATAEFADFADFGSAAMSSGGGIDADDDFGPFATTSPSRPPNPTPDPFAEDLGSNSSNKVSIDDIFGEGDHSDLLLDLPESNSDDAFVDVGAAEEPTPPTSSGDAASAVFESGESIAALVDAQSTGTTVANTSTDDAEQTATADLSRLAIDDPKEPPDEKKPAVEAPMECTPITTDVIEDKAQAETETLEREATPPKEEVGEANIDKMLNTVDKESSSPQETDGDSGTSPTSSDDVAKEEEVIA